MANNRLWAVCQDHGDCEMIQKYYPCDEGWGTIECVNPERCSKFMTKHSNCPSNQGCGENILFVTEQDDRVELYDFSQLGNFKIIIKK